MDTATGSPVLIRAFRLALTVEGLRPRTVQNYVSSAQQFAAHLGDQPLRGVKPSDIREFTVTAQERLAPEESKPSRAHQGSFVEGREGERCPRPPHVLDDQPRRMG